SLSRDNKKKFKERNMNNIDDSSAIDANNNFTPDGINHTREVICTIVFGLLTIGGLVSCMVAKKPLTKTKQCLITMPPAIATLISGLFLSKKRKRDRELQDLANDPKNIRANRHCQEEDDAKQKIQQIQDKNNESGNEL
ncbi:MAG: hypothetical protein VXZ72_04255, partial [Chlamydiota bacterium]|nr:hypothetical protein [Chlamydiota bacterium]